MWFMKIYAMARRYGLVGGSMRALTRIDLVRATDTGRQQNKVDRDHLEPIVTISASYITYINQPILP